MGLRNRDRSLQISFDRTSDVSVGYHREFICYCMYAVDDTSCGELMSEVVPCADFMFNVSMKNGKTYYVSCIL